MTYFLIGDFETWPIIIQSIVVFFIGWFVNFCFECWQQRNLSKENMPSTKDTMWDCNYFAGSALIALWIVKLCFLIF